METRITVKMEMANPCIHFKIFKEKDF